MDIGTLDTITIFLGAWFVATLILSKYLWNIRDLIKAALKATTRLGENNYAIAVRWCVDNRIRFDNPEIDDKDPFKWYVKEGKSKLPREIKKGSVRTGPDNIDFVLLTDDCTSSVEMNLDLDENKLYKEFKKEVTAQSVNLDNLTKNKVGSTPAYIQSQLDLAYTDGFQEGFNRSNNWGILDSLTQNWQTVAIIILVLAVAGVILHDKVIGTPACYNKLVETERSNDELIAKCSPYIKDLTTPQKEATTPSNPSKTGGGINKI